MIVYERAVRFEDVDAAGILFFAHFLKYCHEAMEAFFDGVPTRVSGMPGYVELITRRRIGFPAVHVEADFRAPLRYGDAARIATTVTKVGQSSATFRYGITRVRDGVDVATLQHVVVASDLTTMTKVNLPDDVRALLETHAE